MARPCQPHLPRRSAVRRQQRNELYNAIREFIRTRGGCGRQKTVASDGSASGLNKDALSRGPIAVWGAWLSMAAELEMPSPFARRPSKEMHAHREFAMSASRLSNPVTSRAKSFTSPHVRSTKVD